MYPLDLRGWPHSMQYLHWVVKGIQIPWSGQEFYGTEGIVEFN